MDTLPIPGTAGYGTHAAALAAQYESIAFADVHRSTLHLFPRTPSRVLDIGAGSGRDAAALVRAGHHVVAAEPTAACGRRGSASTRGCPSSGWTTTCPRSPACGAASSTWCC